MVKQELQTLVGNNLRVARLARNLTREELAEKVGISTTFYANLECGNKMMSIITLQKLSEALCVSADALLYGNAPNERIKGIAMCLHKLTQEDLEFVEKLVRMCAEELPGERKKHEEVAHSNDQRTESVD